jgi:hypothetical protein
MLVVCGDSFSYGVGDEHWPRIVADELDVELTNLSIVGAGNFTICHQLQHCISNLNPSLVVVCLSASERFEIDQDEFGSPATIMDFEQKIDEIKYSYSDKEATICSGNLISHLRNVDISLLKNQIVTNSYRLSSQNQAWAINYLMSKVDCPSLLYRNIFPRFYDDKKLYQTEHYFGLENFINSGPADYESEYVKTTNHLSDEDNVKFADRVIKDIG